MKPMSKLKRRKPSGMDMKILQWRERPLWRRKRHGTTVLLALAARLNLRSGMRRLLLPLLLLLFVASAEGAEHKEREFQECADCPVMVGIPAGSFVMGSPAGETGH